MIGSDTPNIIATRLTSSAFKPDSVLSFFLRGIVCRTLPRIAASVVGFFFLRLRSRYVITVFLCL